MPRIARVIVPNCPHHITHRGNRRQVVFFSDEDRKLYLQLLLRYGDRYGLKFWAYCLMPNHVHLIAVPEKRDSMNLTLREAHKKYTSQINIQRNWRGSLWQEDTTRFRWKTSISIGPFAMWKIIQYAPDSSNPRSYIPGQALPRMSSAKRIIFCPPDGSRCEAAPGRLISAKKRRKRK